MKKVTIKLETINDVKNFVSADLKAISVVPVSEVLKIKPCKRNNHQNSDHTKDAVQTWQR